MRMKKIFSLILTMLVVLSCAAGAVKAEEPATKVVVDGLGREVEIPWPVERAVVANRYNSELIRACGAIDRVISVDTNTAQDRAYWSQFDPDNVIGKGQSDLNYEKIVELGAQILITAKNGKWEQDAEMLEPFGIKVLVVTGWDNANLVAQIEAVGRIFGVEENAAKLVDFYESNQKQLDDCLANVTEKKTVYWEYGDPFTTCIPGTSNDGWHNMIVSAGGINIFGDPDLAGKDIDPEAILTADPDLIIKTSSGPALKNTGVYTPPTQEMYEDIVAEMVSRTGWSDLKAVKNKNLYCTTGFCAGGLGKLIGALYTATWLYPEECASIDPDAVFAEWMSMQNVEPISGHVYRLP